MDWSKAKNILITLLLALNALLLASVVSRAVGAGEGNGMYEDVGQILEKRGVAMLCDFPRDVRDSELLIYEDGSAAARAMAESLSGGAPLPAAGGGAASWRDPSGSVEIELLGGASFVYRNAAPSEGIGMADAAALDSGVRAALAAKGVDLSQFALDSAAAADGGGEWSGGGGGAELCYAQKYKGKLVFDSTVCVTVSASGGISEISVRRRGIKDDSQGRLMSVVPAYQVVLKHYAESGQAIRSIDIGFMGQNAPADGSFVESEEGAVWRVRTEGGGERFFEAAYGDEIFPQPDWQ